MKEGQRGELHMAGWRGSGIMHGIRRYLFPAVLLLYPLRHIWRGLDLMDTGYNYANFRFMGMEHMDPMWLFSTYLANSVGFLLGKLPFGDTLLGMNFYTAWIVSALALCGYYFCTKKIGMDPGTVFLGEILAVSLCWCPGAVLYNYLTYLFFLGGCIFLYLGLRDDKNRLLLSAGVCLGLNVFVRFSNLAETGMILAVWGYGIVCRSGIRKILSRTGWCVLGYLAAVGAGLAFFALFYGPTAYFEGIARLMGMTQNAQSYTALAMVRKMLLEYWDMVYWVTRFLVFVLAALVLCALLSKKWPKAGRICGTLLIAAGIVWLYVRGFCSLKFYVYDAMLRPGIVFLMLALGMGIASIFHPKTEKKDKLLSGIVVLVILLTPLGSNNGLIQALNNLFLVGPYVFRMLGRFCRSALRGIYPLKAAAVMLCGVMLIQGLGFGAVFMFSEGAGAGAPRRSVENNPVLRGVLMDEKHAEWMTQLSAYAKEAMLWGREVILYGNIPGVAYYLDMPPAFNPWCDLASYGAEVMQDEMAEEDRKIAAGEEPPVVILEKNYEDLDAFAAKDEKAAMIASFLDRFGYELTFRNDKFLVYCSDGKLAAAENAGRKSRGTK